MNTTTISFRAHKNLRSWLVYASKTFKSKGELLTLIITHAAAKQSSESKVNRLLDGLLSKSTVPAVGDTIVYAVRLPASTAELVRECASRKENSVSQWCAGVLLAWVQAFRELYIKENGAKTTAWLPPFAAGYRKLVAESQNVYAQKAKNKG